MSLPNNLQLCRLCLFEKSSYVDIFEMNEKHGFRIADVINEMLELDVSPGDGLPDRICHDCLNEMARFKRFKNLCQEAKLTLKYIIALATGAVPPPATLPSFLNAAHSSLAHSKKIIMPPSSVVPLSSSSNSSEHLRPMNSTLNTVGSSSSRETVSAYAQVKLEDASHLSVESSSFVSCPTIQAPSQLNENRVDGDPTGFTDGQEDSDVENLCDGPLPVETVLSEPDTEVENVNRVVGEGIIAISQNGEREDTLGMFPISSIINDLDVTSNPIMFYKMAASPSEGNSCISRTQNPVIQPEQIPQNTSNNVASRPLDNPNKYPFWCQICGKNFMRKDKLKQHSVVHSNERPFICRICGCSYKRKDKLTSHVTSSHLQHLPHQCDICGKRFVRKDKLKQHSVVHSNRRPYGCKECGKRYKSKTELKKHEKRTHVQEQPA